MKSIDKSNHMIYIRDQSVCFKNWLINMSKGQLTRENIVAQAAALFNTRGFAGSSLAELMQITGLKKGGI